MARKILLADDSVTAQNMGRRILTDAGYEVATVNNGSAALKRIAEWKPDLIVLDVYMPGYGGLEVCQRLREAPETARIPVLLSVGKLEPFKADDSKRVRADCSCGFSNGLARAPRTTSPSCQRNTGRVAADVRSTQLQSSEETC